MANGGQVECFVVVSACGEHRAIAQSRCLGLTGTDMHYYTRAECPPYGQVPAYRKPVSQYLASFELSAQVATEAGCYNDGRV